MPRIALKGVRWFIGCLLIIAQHGRGDSLGRGAVLVARDKATGEVVASIDLPRRAIGTPMTYMLNDRQYVALTIQGDPPELIALSLPGSPAFPD